ncbi:MAG: trimethylamine methyltransferase family protein [Candidatus Bathyarchaeota archaeon]|nr:trimethylamine methyltransferase family protein [Candidatus Bathyarchaeota archaeon]MDH5788320.1 trimethylamine methyltransferase family protein [Candidatus Bathyarchaeota archaeon]
MVKKFLEFLSNDEVETIHATSTKVLETVGVEIENENAMKIFAEAGANVDFANKRVYISEGLVKEALEKVPSEVKLYGFDEEHNLVFADRNIYFNPGSTALYILDRETMNMRRPTSKDFADFVRLTDFLEHIHAQSTAMTVSDVPDAVVDRFRFYIILKNSVKPIIAGAFTIEGLYDMKHMLEIVVGGEEALRKRPCLLIDVCPSPPLKWSKLTSQNLIDSAGFNIPIEIIPAPQLGSTAPATLAGLLVQHNAEFLSGLVLTQLVNAGVPVVYSGSPSLMDMRYGTGCVGNIEVVMLSAAYAQIARMYHIPSGAYLGISETKIIDVQTGLESAIGLITGTLAGINCITGPGMLGFENCQSFEKLVIDNEICGMALRIMKDVNVSDETLAFELIKKVGPGKHFLSEKHTLKWFQIEEYIPSPVLDKIGKPRWESMGAKDTLKRAKEHVDKILTEHHIKPLTSDKEKELNSFMAEIMKREPRTS